VSSKKSMVEPSSTWVVKPMPNLVNTAQSYADSKEVATKLSKICFPQWGMFLKVEVDYLMPFQAGVNSCRALFFNFLEEPWTQVSTAHTGSLPLECPRSIWQPLTDQTTRIFAALAAGILVSENRFPTCGDRFATVHWTD